MILFPAIDLKEGLCVNLVQGDMERSTIYNEDPVDQAEKFEAQGFQWLHIVDLNGSFDGRPVNADAVEGILEATEFPVQLGGGIRDLATIETWLEKGVRRVILGTLAVRDPALTREACARFPGQIVIGLDVLDGKVAVEGWAEVSELSALDLARKYEDAGAAALLHTDIGRDGTLEGANVAATAALAAAVDVPLIVSGGVGSLADLVACKAEAHKGIEGVISGRALYDGRIDPAEALKLLAD